MRGVRLPQFRRPIKAAGLPSVLILLAFGLMPAGAVEVLFRDGFESCGASSWSSATGLPQCASELACAAQPPGQACVAGHLLDIENNSRICTAPPTTATCTSSASGGPCALTLRVFDAVGLATDPGTAPPLATGETIVDGCGRFRLSGFPVPSSGFAALTVDDAGDTADTHVLSARTFPATSASKTEQLRLYAVAHATDDAWESTAGSPFAGSTFTEQGTIAAIFLHAGVPVAGVILLSNGSTVPGLDYYFSDPESDRRSVVDSGATSAGANGTALFASTSFSNVGGSGGEPASCVWPALASATAPGVLLVQEINAVIDGNPGTPCP